MAKPNAPTGERAPLDSGKLILSLILIFGTVGIFGMLMFFEIPPSNRDLVIAVVSAWVTLGFASMIKFNFDGTKAGDAKNQTIADQAQTARVVADSAAAVLSQSNPVTAVETPATSLVTITPAPSPADALSPAPELSDPAAAGPAGDPGVRPGGGRPAE